MRKMLSKISSDFANEHMGLIWINRSFEIRKFCLVKLKCKCQKYKRIKIFGGDNDEISRLKIEVFSIDLLPKYVIFHHSRDSAIFPTIL